MARHKKKERSSSIAATIAAALVGILDGIGLGFLAQNEDRHPFGDGLATRVILGIAVVLTMIIMPLAALPWEGNRGIAVGCMEGFLLFMLGAAWLPALHARACFRIMALFIFAGTVAAVNTDGAKMLPALLFIGIPSLIYGLFGARRQ